MSSISSLLRLLLFGGGIPSGYTQLAPRTFRPNLSGSPSSVTPEQTRLNQSNGTSGVGYNSSWRAYSSGTSGTQDFSKMTTRMVHSSLEPQNASVSLSTSRRREKICGTRTQHLGYYQYDRGVESHLHNFTNFCALWDRSCPGNESFAEGMYNFRSLHILRQVRFPHARSYLSERSLDP